MVKMNKENKTLSIQLPTYDQFKETIKQGLPETKQEKIVSGLLVGLGIASDVMCDGMGLYTLFSVGCAATQNVVGKIIRNKQQQEIDNMILKQELINNALKIERLEKEKEERINNIANNVDKDNN